VKIFTGSFAQQHLVQLGLLVLGQGLVGNRYMALAAGSSSMVCRIGRL
jgi:hypothetical protein